MQDYSENCNKCFLCHLIDIESLPSLRIINPDGNFIKKEQILELRTFFSKESQFTKESIYIILNAEKMNKESANTMLKFLEEPSGNIIGFFITNQKENVISTIQSRCQIIKVNFNNDEYEEYGLTQEEYNDYLETIKEYLSKIEIEKKELILYNKKYLSEYDKDSMRVVLQIILSIYKKTLNNKIIKSENIEINEGLDFLSNLSILNLKKKINILVELLKEINYNVNMDLLLDRFVIEMDGINNESI